MLGCPRLWQLADVFLQEDCFLEVGVDDGAEEGLEGEVEDLEEEMDCLVEN